MNSNEGLSGLRSRAPFFRHPPAIVLSGLLLGSAAVWAQPRTLRVPGDFPTIQAALDNASGLVVDTVLVDPGIYHESLQLLYKDVRIVGAGGASACYLEALPGAGAVGFGQVGAGTVLTGFTITNSSTAISFGTCGAATVISNTIVNCGAGIYGTYSSPIIRSNRFLYGSGPAISLTGVVAPAVIEGNLLQGNNGAIRMNSTGTPLIRNNIIRDTVGDAVGLLNQTEATVSQNLIVNSTGSGIVSAISCYEGLLILNNTIYGNGRSSGAGIAVAGYGGCTRIINNLVVGTPAVYGDGVPPFMANNDIFSRAGAAYSGVLADQTGTNGNISADPYFVCEPSEEFQLLIGSPCIDAGTSNGVTLPLTDFYGRPRIVIGHPGGSAVVDIGAFEFDPSRAPDPCLFLYCPSNMVVIAPPGQNSAVVNYPAPYATPVASVTASPASGSVFPAADNLVSVTAVYGTNVLNCSFTIRLFTTTDFGRALNMTNTAWLTSGDASWFVQSNITHSGLVAPQSGAITNNQTSSLQTTLTGPGVLTFWWKVSSEANHDLLSLTVNGSTQAVISGQVDWQPRTVYVGSGAQVFQWTYAKDASGSAGQDAAWLDQVTWAPGPAAPIITIQPANLSLGAGMNAVFSVSVGGTPPLNFQWSFNGQSLPGATSPSLVITNIQASNVGSYSVVVSNQAGAAFSTNASLTLAKVIAWGADSYGQTNVPAGLTNVAAIAGGWHHSVALRTDGTVVAWGANNRGQTNVPASLSNVVAIASRSGDHCMALRTDGKVVVWGDNSYGQANVPAGLSNVVAIAAGGARCLALKADGTATSWGDSTTVPAGLSNLVAVSGGDSGSLFLRSNGTVAATGTTVPASVTNIIAIAAGGLHYLALRANGTVIAWGDNSAGQTSIPIGLDKVVAIAACDYHSTALRADSTVVAWGKYYTGSDYLVPVVPASLTNVLAIAAGSDHDLALLGEAPPQLTLSHSGPNLVLTWTARATGFTLQSTTNLVSPVWAPVSQVPIVVNGRNTVTNPISGTQQFYRLLR